jgi:hypothetical protein
MEESVSDLLRVRIALGLLNIAPLPVAWWIGRRLARGALGVLVGGMAVAFAFEILNYWAAFFGPYSRPLTSGLAFLAVPAFQLPFLAVIVLLAWFVARRRRQGATTQHVDRA